MSSKYSILPALSLDGILDMVVIDGSMNKDVFMQFVEGVLMEMNPFPGKNSVLVMDNARIHANEAVQALVEDQ
jgi:hypothetical protein